METKELIELMNQPDPTNEEIKAKFAAGESVILVETWSAFEALDFDGEGSAFQEALAVTREELIATYPVLRNHERDYLTCDVINGDIVIPWEFSSEVDEDLSDEDETEDFN